jgi:hypothetical protein
MTIDNHEKASLKHFLIPVGYELQFIDDNEKLKIAALAYYCDGMNREGQKNLGL